MKAAEISGPFLHINKNDKWSRCVFYPAIERTTCIIWAIVALWLCVSVNMCYHYVTVSTQRRSIQHKVHFTSCYIGCKYLRMCLYKGCQSITVATVKEIIETFCSVRWMQPGSQGNEINGFSFNGHSWLLEKQFSLGGWLRQQAGYWAKKL